MFANKSYKIRSVIHPFPSTYGSRACCKVISPISLWVLCCHGILRCSEMAYLNFWCQKFIQTPDGWLVDNKPFFLLYTLHGKWHPAKRKFNPTVKRIIWPKYHVRLKKHFVCPSKGYVQPVSGGISFWVLLFLTLFFLFTSQNSRS